MAPPQKPPGRRIARRPGALQAKLEKRIKPQLVALIRHMLMQAPELEGLLDMPLPTGEVRPSPAPAEVYYRQAAAAFAHGEFHGPLPSEVAHHLEALRAIATGFAAERDFRSAAAVCSGLLTAVAEEQEVLSWDERDELIEVVIECIDTLGQCLEEVDGEGTRQSMLEALFAIRRTHLRMGGLGFSDVARTLLLHKTTEPERRKVAESVRPELDRSEGWARQSWGGLRLAEQDAGPLRPARRPRRLEPLHG
jgi:hypothetical protein